MGTDEQGHCFLSQGVLSDRGGRLTAVALIPYQAAAVEHDCIVVQCIFLCDLCDAVRCTTRLVLVPKFPLVLVSARSVLGVW